MSTLTKISFSSYEEAIAYADKQRWETSWWNDTDTTRTYNLREAGKDERIASIRMRSSKHECISDKTEDKVWISLIERAANDENVVKI